VAAGGYDISLVLDHPGDSPALAEQKGNDYHDNQGSPVKVKIGDDHYYRVYGAPQGATITWTSPTDTDTFIGKFVKLENSPPPPAPDPNVDSTEGAPTAVLKFDDHTFTGAWVHGGDNQSVTVVVKLHGNTIATLHGYFNVIAPNFTDKTKPDYVKATITAYENDNNGVEVLPGPAGTMELCFGTTTAGNQGVNFKTDIQSQGWKYAWVQTINYYGCSRSWVDGGEDAMDRDALDGVGLNSPSGDTPSLLLAPGQNLFYSLFVNTCLMVEIGDDDTWVPVASTGWSFTLEAKYSASAPHRADKVSVLSADCSVKEETRFEPTNAFPGWSHKTNRSDFHHWGKDFIWVT